MNFIRMDFMTCISISLYSICLMYEYDYKAASLLDDLFLAYKGSVVSWCKGSIFILFGYWILDGGDDDDGHGSIVGSI